MTVFLNPVIIISILFGIGFCAIVIMLKNTKLISQIFENIYIITLFGSLVGVVGLLVLNGEKFIYTVNIVLQNIFYLGKTGSWGYTPFAIMLYVIIAFLNHIFHYEDTYTKCFDTFLLAYFFLTVLICSVRETPIRFSVADSGNRMLMQIIPTIYIMLLVNLRKNDWVKY